MLALGILVTVIFSGFACAKRSHSVATDVASRSSIQTSATFQRININTASAKELEALPGIGKGLAARIIGYRQKYGPFAKPEHVLMVHGISEHRFVAIRDQITVE
jgi:competence protein ComEA